MKIWKLIFASLAFSTNVNAALINNGNYTTDTSTGLDWLDVTESTGLSYDYVSTQFATGGQFEGWSYATATDLEILFFNAGDIGPYDGQSSSHNPYVPNLQALWGVTSFLEGGSISKFTYEGSFIAGYKLFGRVLDIYDNTNPINSDEILLTQLGLPSNLASFDTGHALIRTTVVPIPGAFLLFSSGIFFMFSLSKHRESSIST